ncbi:hypothetical protein GCM10010269_39970 [Streptomyces humidus]|uniref:Uncharacterized protein n=1 Tax=Streptomyces humidus TaxID=52259 RepID=A0A918FXD3_9ACTN|nr:hypothetical protein GCM10010269_39970 [Streptomyces humidus]
MPYLPYLTIVPAVPPYRHAALSAALGGTATSARLPVRPFPRGVGERCAVNVSLHVIFPLGPYRETAGRGCRRPAGRPGEDAVAVVGRAVSAGPSDAFSALLTPEVRSLPVAVWHGVCVRWRMDAVASWRQ